MKFFAVFATVLAVASAGPQAWTLNQLTSAIENPNTFAEFVPVLEHALNEYMHAIFAGEHKYTFTISTAPGVGGTFTLAQLDAALSSSSISPVFKPFLEDALNKIMSALHSGQSMETAAVHIPALELSYWSLQELDAALTSPATNPALTPYLEAALNHLMADIFNGGTHLSTLVIVPAEVSAPAPAPVVSPIVPGPAIPPPELSPVASSSPLVQIILNVENSDAVGIVGPSPVIERPFPEPTIVRPTPEPVVIRPTPEPVVIRPSPEPVVIRPSPEPVVIRPIPEPVLINPIDILAPLPVESVKPNPAGAVGPMV